jgi:ATP-dependent exoDNAse (exonuclease V) alpha subunit
MAMFRLDIRSIKRSMGQTATAAAAYRAGERIRDERTGNVHNHSRRKDVTHTEIFLPSQFGDAPMEWARDRTRLWNTAESAENRRNSRVAREFQVSLPSELSATQRLSLARNFAREVSDRYGVAVDLAIHDPKPSGDPRQFHAHLLTTTREVTRDGLGAKAGLDMQGGQRFQMGLSDHKTEYVAVRERWASLTNAAFKEANLETRVDHRTLEAQGIDRQPMVHVPMEFYRSQMAGLDPDAREKMREDYRAWIESRRPEASREAGAEPQAKQAASPAQPAEVLQPQREERAEPAIEPRPSTEHHQRSEPEPPAAPRTVADIRRRAVQNWLQMRSKGAESPRNEQDRQRTSEVNPTRGQGEDRGR